ncbi:MAG TPA: hypothetical protein VNH18_29500 [Bryobacteraceae bacterium]|nr:hypothetical protein [Blastocatellia bacterium]HXJ43454.1 hypothetical protein [Bryobacteraceae bacterium]
MPIMKLETGRPYELALKYKSGKDTVNKFTQRPEKMFTLTKGDLLYLPNEVAESIAELHLGPQEPFLLTKHAKSWDVERKSKPMPAKPQAPKAELLTQLGHVLTGANELTPAELGYVLNGSSTEPMPAPAAPAVISNGHSSTVQNQKSVNRFYLDRAEKLIDVFAAAYDYALKNHKGTVSKEDVRALTTTVFIQCTPKPYQNGREV